MNSTAKAQTASTPNIYSRITDRILAALEQGVRPWVQPWSSKHAAGPISRPLRHNGTPYTGINVLSLWCTAVERGYVAPIWMTFRQALELDAHVRKGETGTLVVYASSFKVDENSTDDDKTEREVHYLKGYAVFNVEQIEGLPAQYTAQLHAEPNPAARIATAEAFVARSQATIRTGGNRAFFDPQADRIQMPPFVAFRDAEGYYATLLHELTQNAEPPFMPHGLGHQCIRRAFGPRGFGIISALPMPSESSPYRYRLGANAPSLVDNRSLSSCSRRQTKTAAQHCRRSPLLAKFMTVALP
jgi:antirestriction protein ArdC